MEKESKQRFRLTKLERAWILYDVGNSAFVLMVATLIPIFFNALAAAGGLSSVEYLAYWGYATSVVTIITAILSPILGTLADTKGFKKPIFILCVWVGIVGCIAMGKMSAWLPFLVIFVIAKVGFSGSLVYYDSMLSDVTSPERMDEVSSKGYAWGYIGSCAPFVACLGLVLGADKLGISQMKALDLALLITAFWWLLTTLPLTALAFALSMLIAVAVAYIQYAKVPVLSQLARFYIWVIRGTPLMLQLLVIYYFPGLVWKNNIWGSGEAGRFVASSVAFVFNYACYFSEIYRGGIQGVPKGQQEAGQVLGMTKSQIFFQVTLLQMVKKIVPPMSNEIITLVKDTSLSRIIALQEVIWAGQAFMKGSQGISGAIWPLFFTGVYYLIFSGILTLVLGRVEKKLDYFKA